MQPRSSDQSAGMMMTNLTRECIPRCSWKRKDVRDPKHARTATTFLCHVVGSHKKNSSKRRSLSSERDPNHGNRERRLQ